MICLRLAVISEEHALPENVTISNACSFKITIFPSRRVLKVWTHFLKSKLGTHYNSAPFLWILMLFHVERTNNYHYISRTVMWYFWLQKYTFPSAVSNIISLQKELKLNFISSFIISKETLKKLNSDAVCWTNHLI